MDSKARQLTPEAMIRVPSCSWAMAVLHHFGEMKATLANAALVAVCTFLTASCSTDPLATEVTGIPSRLGPGEQLEVHVRVENRSRETQLLPLPSIVERTSAIRFIPRRGDDLGGLVSGDFAIVRNSIDVSPPAFDHLSPGDLRDYTLTWTPLEDDRGAGLLSVSLPYPFGEVSYWPITIGTEEGEGANAGPSSR